MTRLDATAAAVAGLLGLVVVAIAVLAGLERTIPDVFPLLGTTLTGALVARMMPTGTTSSGEPAGRRGPGDPGEPL